MELLTPALLATVLVALGFATASLLIFLFLLLLLFLLFPFRFGLRLSWDNESQAISWKLRLLIPFAGHISYGRHHKVSDLLSGRGIELPAALSPSPRRADRLGRWTRELLRRLARRGGGLAGGLPGMHPGHAFLRQTAAEGWEIASQILRSFDRLHLRVRFGTGDAAATALLYGTAWAALGQLPINWNTSRPRPLGSRFHPESRRQLARLAVELTPDFSAHGGALAVSCIGEVRPGQIILALTQYWAKARRRGHCQRRRLSDRAGSRAVGYRGETSHG